MRRFLIFLSLVLLAVAAPQRGFSQSADSSELFLNAYMANEQGQQLENSGDTRKALSKYRYAASLLEQINHDAPNWQPIVVDYRKKKVSENIARLQQQTGGQSAPAESPSMPIEGELPQKDITPTPDLTNSQEPAPIPPGPSSGGGVSQQVRDQLDQLQNELRSSRQRLKSVESEKEDLAGKLDDALKQIDRTKINEVELKGQLKQAQDAYQNSLSDHSQAAGGQKVLQGHVAQLQDALKNAEADRDAANEQHEEDARRAGKAREAAETSATALKAQLKQTQDALAANSQPGGPQKVLQTRITQLEDALKNAEADRDAATAQSDEDVRRAAKAHEAAAASEAALKAQLKQSQDALAGQSSQTSGAQKALLARVTELENALKTTEADRDAATAQSDENARRASKAREATDAVTRQLDAANAKNKDLAAKFSDASKLVTQLDAAKKQIAALTKDRDDATQRADDLDKELSDTSRTAAKLADAQKQVAALKAGEAETAAKNSEIAGKLADARKQIDQLTEDRDTARQQVTALNGKLADATKEIASVKMDRDQIAAQRDQALADLGKAREAEKHVNQLLADNATLTQKLAADEKTIQEFKSDSPEKDKQIAQLRKEVGDTKALLTSAQQDRDNVQSTLNDLQQQYDSTSAELAELKANNNVSTTDKRTLTDENDLLRGIVLKQLKQQAKRDQAKRLVMSELSQLQVQSDSLLNNINYLSQPVVQLTDKEKTLFKDPAIEIPDADDSTMAISITAPKQPAAVHDSGPVTVANTLPAKLPPDSASPAPDNSPTPAIAATSPAATPMELASRTAPGSVESAIPPAPATEARPASSPAAEKSDAASSTASSGPAPMVPPDMVDDAKSAKEAFERTEYRDAERIYEKMLTKAPNNVYILSNLGVVYFRNEKWKLAEESLKKAIAVAPEDTFSHCTLGIVYYQEKRYDDAINALTRALAINPKYAVAHNYLGITASQKGWQEAALKELETAIEIDPKYADAYFNLAVVYAMQQPPNKDLAGKYYKRATALGAEPDASLEQLVK